MRVFDVLREDSHRRIDNSPTCAESHMGIDLQPLRQRRSPISENLVDTRNQQKHSHGSGNKRRRCPVLSFEAASGLQLKSVVSFGGASLIGLICK